MPRMDGVENSFNLAETIVNLLVKDKCFRDSVVRNFMEYPYINGKCTVVYSSLDFELSLKVSFLARTRIKRKFIDLK